MYNVLIAEDDKDIRELLKLYLESNGFDVTLTNNGKDALEELNKNKFDIILVDIMMPYINGYDFIKEVRKTSDIPIIILSAKNLTEDKVLGLNIGADAYITKPFNPLEVIAQVNSILRRMSDTTFDLKPFVIGELKLDPEKFILRKNDKVIPLTSTEIKIVMKLMQYPGKIFTKSQLYECINGESFENDDNTIMVHISNIRNKIEDDSSKPKYIITVRGLGYKIEKK